jgi:hypothetical protein
MEATLLYFHLRFARVSLVFFSPNYYGIDGTGLVMSFEQYALIIHTGLPEN